jgi:phage FluMu gp28-like protein
VTTLAAPQIGAEERQADREAFEQLSQRLDQGRLLLRYQASTAAKLKAGVQLLVIEKSRRIGLTWGVAGWSALKAAAQASAGGDNVFYMGYEQEMAREFIDACAMWAKAYGIGASAVGEEIFDDVNEAGETKAIKAFRINFASGFNIVALASMPRAFRGKQGCVIIDEAAFHSQLEEKIKAALALLMWGGQVVIISTHDGVMNPFNQLIEKIRSNEQKGEVIKITFDDAIEAGLYERIAEVAAIRGRKVPDKAAWIADIRGFYGANAGEELDVIPKLSGGSLIKLEDLVACQSADAGRPELYRGGLWYLGRDIARRRDGQILWGFEMVGDVFWLRDRWEGVGQTFEAQADAADAMIKQRRMMAYWLDQGGMGEQPVEEARRRYGSSRVEGQLLQGANRLDIALSLATRFEQQRIRIPADPVIRADLLAIKRIPTAGGGVRIGDDPDGTIHADRFWAAALASRAADVAAPEYDYRPVRPADSSSGRSGRLSMRPDHSGDMPPLGRGGGW